MVNWSFKNSIAVCLFFIMVNTGINQADTNETMCINFIKMQGFTRVISAVKCVSRNDRGIFFLVTFKESGFVLVAFSNGQYAVAGYSDNTDFDLTKDNPLSKSLFASEPSMFTRKNLKKTMADEEIPPLGTALFNQKAEWNALCPMDQGSRTVVGCVGTAMAIIMNYWKYPYYGHGSSTYIHETINEISVNFENYRYRWDLMSDDTPDSYNAALLYHCAVAVKTTFGASKSSLVNTNNISYALKANFGFNTGLNLVWRGNFTEEQWIALIKEQVKNNKPVLYMGGDGDDGHAFVIEGYKDGNFYINWGWGGNSNGYFDIGFLYVPPNDYRKDNKAILDIEPQVILPPESVSGTLQEKNVKLSWNPSKENALILHYVLPYRTAARYNSKGPQRMTAFDPATFGFTSPVKVYGIGHSFYIDSTYPGDSTYKFILYKGSTSEKLHESQTLKAVTNSEMFYQISSPISVTDSFYVAVAPSGTDSLPPSYASIVEKDVCHSQYGEPGSWTMFNYSAPGGRELHTYVYITGTRAKGHFPQGGYIVVRNGIAIDTINSLEECAYTDNAPVAGKNCYQIISYRDTTAYTSVASDSITVQNGTLSTVMKTVSPQITFKKNAFTLQVGAPVKVVIEAFTIDGRKQAVIKDEMLDIGAYTIPVKKFTNNSSGFLIVRVKVGNRCYYVSVLSGK